MLRRTERLPGNQPSYEMSASFPMLLPPPVTKPVLKGVGAPVWFEDLRHQHHPGSVLKLEYP